MQLLGTLAFFPEQMTVEPRRPARLIMGVQTCRTRMVKAEAWCAPACRQALPWTAMMGFVLDGSPNLFSGHYVGSSRRTGSGLELVSDPLSVHEGGAASRFRSGLARRGG